jgi:hypothetical protein
VWIFQLIFGCLECVSSIFGFAKIISVSSISGSTADPDHAFRLKVDSDQGFAIILKVRKENV